MRLFALLLLSGWLSTVNAESWVKSMGLHAPIYVDLDSRATHPETTNWQTALIAEPASDEQSPLFKVAFTSNEQAFSLNYRWSQVKQSSVWKSIGNGERNHNWHRINSTTPAAILLARKAACG